MTSFPAVDTWLRGPERPELADDALHLWRFELSADDPTHRSLAKRLDAVEKSRAARFKYPELRRRYEVAHGRLRDVLARYIERPPEAIAFTTNPRGKPDIATRQNPARVAFSFSHSGDMALVAVAKSRRIGVDVEVYRDRLDMDLIARRQFTAGETERLRAAPVHEREQAFYRCWTRKEAYMKALGAGISGRLDSFEVTFEHGREPRILRCAKENPDHWLVIPLALGTRVEGACVVERPIHALHQFTLTDV